MPPHKAVHLMLTAGLILSKQVMITECYIFN